ncbi:MAG: gamma-glutamyl-gamma-aminobutyrate hydrolase family protein [Bacteroidota bacterium]
MRIGITDNHRPKPVFDNYFAWIHRIDPAIELVKLSYHLDNAGVVPDLDGLLLTGGGDVHPALYGKPEYLELIEETNEKRDEFELEVIEHALKADLPILGICRGMQIMNVALGGTLIGDLQRWGYRDHTQRNSLPNRHAIETLPHSMLETITGGGKQEINSVHHQAIDEPGKGLVITAKSEDGVIEAAEWMIKDGMPFLLLVQWHPERMADFDSPTSRAVAEQFVREVRISINT